MNYYLDEPENSTIEIDITELLFVLRRKLWLIIICGIFMGGIAFSYSKYMITPQYSSSSSFLILTKETTLASISDLNIGKQLTMDYEVLTLSRTVLQEVVDNLKLDFDYKTLKSKISISNPSDTRILVLTVTDIDAERACAIVDELAQVAAEYIGDKMEGIPPKIIESGEVDRVPVSPNIMKNTLLGAFIGVFLCVAVLVLIAILDDTIKSEEDVEKYLQISNLASVPDRKDYIGKKMGKKNQRKNQKKNQKKSAASQRRGQR